MNKTIMFLGMLAAGFANAQQTNNYDGKVGVNTDQPSATLNVQSKEDTGKSFELDKVTSDPRTRKPVNTKLVTVLNSGYTGIGTDRPKELLHVMGGIRSQREGDLGGFIDIVNTDKIGYGNEQKVGMWRFYNQSAPNVEGLHLFGYPEDRATNPFNHTRSVLVIGDNGNIGVGTGNALAPSEKLHIGIGNVRVQTLPTNLGSNQDKLVVVDPDGVLKSIEQTTAEWVYDTDTKRINLHRSGELGQDAKFKNKIYYNTETGQFINTYADQVRQSTIVADAFSVKNDEEISNISKAKNINIISSKNMESVLNGGVNAKSIHYNRLDVDPTEEALYMMVNNNELNIESDNDRSYTYAYADAVNANLRGTGKVNFALGQWGQVNVRNQQSVEMAVGVAGVANMATTGNVDLAYGVRGNVASGILSGSQSVVKTAAADRFDFTGKNNVLFKNNIGISVYSTNLSTNTGQGDQIVGIHNTVLNQGKTKYTNMYGIYTNSGIYENAVAPTNQYGLYIDNIKDGEILNYAIYTNGGKVHLGDEVEVKSTIKVADNTVDKTCTTEKAGTIRFDATAKKFQGCTGDNWVDLHN